jgi:hypothetical protein
MKNLDFNFKMDAVPSGHETAAPEAAKISEQVPETTKPHVFNGSNGFQLPLVKRKATRVNPRRLLLFSLPKVGKTETAAQLPDSLIIDLENGTDMVDATATKINNYNDLYRLRDTILEAGKPYKYLIFDTVTALETLAMDLAEFRYSETPMGKNWFVTDKEGEIPMKQRYQKIINMPNGAGYPYLGQAVDEMLSWFDGVAEYIILMGHLKSTSFSKEGKDLNVDEIDLTGKIKRTVSANCDAIGYMYRKFKNENYINFQASDQVVVGARPPHLTNKQIKISEKNLETNELQTFWGSIYVGQNL